jgi:hypothetical protein
MFSYSRLYIGGNKTMYCIGLGWEGYPSLTQLEYKYYTNNITGLLSLSSSTRLYIESTSPYYGHTLHSYANGCRGIKYPNNVFTNILYGANNLQSGSHFNIDTGYNTNSTLGTQNYSSSLPSTMTFDYTYTQYPHVYAIPAKNDTYFVFSEITVYNSTNNQLYYAYNTGSLTTPNAVTQPTANTTTNVTQMVTKASDF